MIDISILNMPELQSKLNKLPDKVAKKAVRPAIRASAKRATARIVTNINRQGLIDSGALIEAFETAKIRAFTRHPGKLIRIGPAWPTREELGIDPNDPYYYPTVLEFGAGSIGTKNPLYKRYKAQHGKPTKTIPATPYLRPAIDEHKDEEVRVIGNEIGKNIEKVARR